MKKIAAVFLTLILLFSCVLPANADSLSGELPDGAGFYAAGAETHAESGTSAEAETSAEEAFAETDAPGKAENDAGQETPAENGIPAETGTSEETEGSAESETPAETGASEENEGPAESETPAEAELPAEQEEAGEALITEQAYAAPGEGFYAIRPFTDNKLALYIPGASTAENKALNLSKVNSSYAQKFRFIPVDGEPDTYLIWSFSSGKYLGLKNSEAVNSAAVVQKSGSSGSDKRWRFKENSDGSVTVCSAMNEKMVLDIKAGKIAHGSAVQLYASNNSEAQKWTLKKVKDPTAGTPDDGMYKIMSGVGGYEKFALNIQGRSKNNGANISIYRSDESNYEKFNIASVGYGNYYKVINVGSGKSLDVAGNKKANNTNVQQYTYNGSAAQLFRIVPAGDGAFTIKGAGSGKVLDVKGAKAADNTNVAIYSANGSAAQKWKLVPTKKYASSKSPKLKTGIYNIVTSLNSSFVLDVKSGSTKDGANIGIYESNGSNAQKFLVTALGSGNTYTIKCIKSRKNMEVQGGGSANGTNVRQNSADGSDSQVWKIIPLTGGKYEIVGAASGKALDVSGGKAENNRNVQIYSRNSSAAQKWIFKSATYKPEQVKNVPESVSSSLNSCMAIQPASDESLLVRSAGGKIQKGTAIQTSAVNGSTSSRFFLVSKGSGQYEIVHVSSGMALDVKGAGTADGTAVQIYDRNDSKAQRWKLVSTGDGDGSYYIQSALDTTKVLTVKDGTVAGGKALVLGTRSSSDAQKFIFVNSMPKLDGILKIADKYPVYDKSGKLLKDDFPAAHKYPQLITVGVTNVNYASVSMYTKGTDGSFARNYTASGRIGTNGLGKTVQGDKKTPKGIYTLHTPFGIKDDPGCPVKYTKVTKDHYWGGRTPTASYYNKLADASKLKDYTPGGEHLIDYAGSYNYAVAIGWNLSNTYGKGAAIFLHCSHGSSTAGCVAIPESNMKTTLKKLNSKARIIIDTPEKTLTY